MLFLGAHWRKPMDYTDETLGAAKARADGFREVFRNPSVAGGSWDDFVAALEDDFNTPEALAVMHEWRDHDLLRRGLELFGLGGLALEEDAPSELDELARRRADARAGGDFDIFSPPNWRIPLCIQSRANSRPAPRDWAISFSWCGKTRSSPPPWISNTRPRCFSAIAEHSMCQPGRPRPHGDSHHVSSSGLLPFHNAKSRGSSLRVFGSCSSTWSGRCPDRRP